MVQNSKKGNVPALEGKKGGRRPNGFGGHYGSGPSNYRFSVLAHDVEERVGLGSCNEGSSLKP